MFKVLITCVIAVLLTALVFVALEPIEAAGTWKDRDAMVLQVASDPSKFVDAVALEMGQAGLNRLWVEMFPPPTIQQQKEALREAVRSLRAMDLPADDPVILAIKAKIDILNAANVEK